MPKKSMGGRKNGQIGERKCEQISIFDDYLMGDVEGQDDEYLKEKEPQMYLELIINKTINTEIEDLMKASEIAYQQIKKLVAVEYPEPLELSFIQAVIVENETDMVQKKMMEWLMNQPLIKNRPTYI